MRLMKIEMLDIVNSITCEKTRGSFLTLALSIGLQLGRRRSAGRGLERRPFGRGPKGRLAASRKKKRKEVLVCIYSIPSAV